METKTFHAKRLDNFSTHCGNIKRPARSTFVLFCCFRRNGFYGITWSLISLHIHIYPIYNVAIFVNSYFRMESFFLSETTKYLYLLFDSENFIHNDGSEGRIVDTPGGQCVIEGSKMLVWKQY